MNESTWKFAAVLGGSAVFTIFAIKMDPEAVERVLIHLVDALKEVAIVRRKTIALPEVSQGTSSLDDVPPFSPNYSFSFSRCFFYVLY